MDNDVLWKLAITVFGILGTVGVTLSGILINRLYKSIDILFDKVDKLRRQIEVLKMAVLKNDPDGTALFAALTSNGHEHR